VTKEQLVEKIKALLNTDADLEFLMVLEKKELETLIACIRDRVGYGRSFKRSSILG